MRITIATAIAVLAVLTTAAPRPAGWGNGAAIIPIIKHPRLAIRDVGQTIDVDALNNHVASIRAKILRGFDSYEKNTGKPHPSALKEIAKRGSSDSLSYANEGSYDGVYCAMIGVGTPDLAFIVALDTASSDLLIPSDSCDLSCSGHDLWMPNLSSTAQDLGQTFDIDIGNGIAATGEQYTDTVSLNGYTATGQTFGAATHYDSGFQSGNFPADGVMGMAFSAISSYGSASPVFQTLVSQGQVSEAVFSFKLEPTGGELYIGGSNIASYIGDFSYVPVTTSGFWEVTMDSIGPYQWEILKNIDCVIDTSSNLIIGHPSDVYQLYNALGGIPAPSNYPQGYYTLPCDSFPTLYLTFSGFPFAIPPEDLNLGLASSNSTDCLSAIVGQEIGSSWIIGNVFLRNVYTRFDVGNTQVGFALLNQ